MKLVNPFSGAQLLRFGVVASLATGVLASVAGHGTLAYFTTQVTSGSNTFTAGNLHFTISDNDEAATAPSVATSLTLTNMKPGDVVYAPVSLANTGSVDAKWGIKYTTTTGAANLATALDLAVVAKGNGTADVTKCESTDFATAGIWKEQILATPEAMTNAGRTIVDYTSVVAPATDRVWVAGDTTAGAYLPLKPVGTAAGAATDIVCVRVSFPNTGMPVDLVSGDNAWNGATASTYDTSILFTFDGMQRVLSTESDQ